MCKLLAFLHFGSAGFGFVSIVLCQNANQTHPVLILEHVSECHFKAKVENTLDVGIRLGVENSPIGFDQFQFEIVLDDGRTVFCRSSREYFLMYSRMPVTIERGQHYTFDFFLDLPYWRFSDPSVQDQFDTWKSVAIQYRPKHCRFFEEREAMGVFEIEFDSSPLYLPALSIGDTPETTQSKEEGAGGK